MCVASVCPGTWGPTYVSLGVPMTTGESCRTSTLMIPEDDTRSCMSLWASEVSGTLCKHPHITMCYLVTGCPEEIPMMVTTSVKVPGAPLPLQGTGRWVRTVSENAAPGPGRPHSPCRPFCGQTLRTKPVVSARVPSPPQDLSQSPRPLLPMLALCSEDTHQREHPQCYWAPAGRAESQRFRSRGKRSAEATGAATVSQDST